MTISGVGSSYSYGSHSNKISVKPIEAEVKPIDQISESNSLELESSIDSSQEKESPAPKSSNSESLQNFSFDFKKQNEYNLVGAQSKLEDLDVAKAISDMKKDSVLEQYKFFVKSSLGSDEDGSVRQVIRHE